jgi:hypothetical protein
VIEVDRWQGLRKQSRSDSGDAQTENQYKRLAHQCL